ncbi:acetamidase/formamidase family protein [Actinomadura barringtoniae]|uniref:Acetamidase/formamidase family protein n=1 Tax=Actinomadura barringtoniae TaxID=1427535 RepID=A0A939PRM4_9ACTN|nr:acetamidase/formamidase family protein [Actinomadura barringtoniae]MBO2454949.1 acetamidase/formamidase family protein [Actinomadura barringtoniae]
MTLSLDAPRYTGTGRAVPGHIRWHPDIPAVAEVITGGSVRLECEDSDLLCGPIVVVGAEPGDVIVVDVLGLGRSDGVYAPSGHPGVIGCAPALPAAAEALSTGLRGRDVGGCAIAPLTGGSRILLPVQVRGAKLSAGDLHFPARGAECRGSGRAGWIDLRVHLTRKGVERFGVTGPMLMP